MTYADMTTDLKKNIAVLKFLGLFMEETQSTSFWLKMYSFIMQVIFLGLFNLSLLAYWILNSTDLREFTSCGYIVLTAIISQTKGVLVYKNRKAIRELMKHLEQEQFRDQNQEELVTVIKEFKVFQYSRKILLVSTSLSVAGSLLSPILTKDIAGLPFPAWFPMNISASPAYQIAFFHQSISVSAVGFGYSVVDILLCNVLTFIGLQCKILCLRVEKLGTYGSYKEDHQILINSVGHHLDIIKLLKMTKEVFGMIYFWQIFASTVSLCMTLFLLTVTDSKTFEFIYLTIYVMDISVLLLLPCWFATEMTRKSEKIPIAIYSCDWTNTLESFKKEVVFFIHQSQQPLKLFAGDFFEISVEIYVKIIRSSMSYFAVLRNLNTPSYN